MLKAKELCKKNGMPLKQLAEKMQISPESLTRMLSDKGNPTLSTLTLMATALNVEIFQLLDKYDENLEVRGYLENGGIIHRIENFLDLKLFYESLELKSRSNMTNTED